MRVVDAEFMLSGTSDPAGWPPEGPPEIAFAGRSNVGKSSLLAKMMGRRGLVRVSATPGRTRLLNFFRITLYDEKSKDKSEARFVDLPGYGYAKVSKSERQEWFSFVERYLGARPTLRAVLLLVDGRRGAELDETEIARWLRERGVTIIPVLTKADQLKKHERKPAAEALRKQLRARPSVVSATSGDGVDELWSRVAVALAGPNH